MTESPWNWLTVNEVAARVGVSRYTILNRIDDWEQNRAGGLPAINVGSEGKGARWRINPEALAKWLQRVAA